MSTIGTSNIKFSQVRLAINNSSCRSGSGIGNTDVTFSSFRNSLLASSNTSFVDKNPSNAPSARAYHSSMLTYDHKIVVFGGFSVTTSIDLHNDTYLYDIKNNTWSELHDGTGDAPSKRFLHKCVYYDATNTMYLFGGTIQDTDNTTSDELWKFDLTTNTWSEIRPIGTKPTKRGAHNLEIDGNVIYLFGGINGVTPNDTVYNELWQFSIINTEWTQLSGATNKNRSHASSVIANGNIYIFGGVDEDSTTLNDIITYDIFNNTWDLSFYSGGTPGTTIPPKLSNSSMDALTPTCFFIYGGEDGTNNVEDIWEFHVENKTWKKVFGGATTNMFTKRSNHSMNIDYVDDTVTMIVFGGSISSGYINKTYSYTLSTIFGHDNNAPLKLSDLSGQEFY